MSSQTKSSKLMQQSARFVATELLREPVKQAVREAIHEEASSAQMKSAESQASKPTSSRSQSSKQTSQSDDQSGGGRSKLSMFGLVLAIVGVTYLARRRMSSTTGSAWSEPSPGSVAADDAEGGYVSEGEMQTAETADEGGAGSEGTSQSTTADQ